MKLRSYAEVIGDPISHSKSPLIHNFWLKKLGIDAEYRAHHVLPDDLGAYFSARSEDANWRGCNITIPHKVASLDHVEDRGGLRDSIGAINTVIRSDEGPLIGTNTDAGGFYGPIADVNLKDMPVVVIGSGGAARAVLFTLSKMDSGPVTLLARNALKGMGLLSSFGLKGDVRAMDASLPPAGLLINASPLGMQGYEGALDIDLSPLRDDAIVYDLVYIPLETSLLAAARARALGAIDGMEMLIGQAALAFELFFDVPPPREHDEELRGILIG